MELPIFEFKNQIVQLINENICSIITGETGSGKSTQISQYVLNNDPKKRIVVTQPRRVATI